MGAFDPNKLEAVKHLKHKEKEIILQASEIYNKNRAATNIEQVKHYVSEKFKEAHNCTVTDFEKLVFMTVEIELPNHDMALRILGHCGHSLTEPNA